MVCWRSGLADFLPRIGDIWTNKPWKFRRRKPYEVAHRGLEFHASTWLEEIGYAADWVAIGLALRRRCHPKRSREVTGRGHFATIILPLRKKLDDRKRAD